MSGEESVWTDPRVVQLKKLWADGLSAGQIVAEIDAPGLTRNAVIGKVHRLGLSGRKRGHSGFIEVGTREPKARVARPARVQLRRRPMPAPSSKPAPTSTTKATPAISAIETEAAIELRDLPFDKSSYAVGFFDLKDHHCKHPIGDPSDLVTFRFCGDDREQNEPYCPRHCHLNYGGPGRRRPAPRPVAGTGVLRATASGRWA